MQTKCSSEPERKKLNKSYILIPWWKLYYLLGDCFVSFCVKTMRIRLCELYSSLHVVIITERVTCQQVFSFNEHWGALASFFLSRHVSALLVIPITCCPHMSSHAVLMDNKDLSWPMDSSVCSACLLETTEGHPAALGIKKISYK